MKKDYEKIYHDYEESHFWFKSRRKYILSFLEDFSKKSTVLDIGCSSGILLNELADNGFNRDNLYGVDISETAVKRCKKNNIPNSFVMDAQEIKLEKKFDVIIASDCLEHLENDSKALQNWHNLLNPNGILIVFVPAFMFLWSDHDVVNMHFRRYTKKHLEKRLNESQFEIKKSSYWNFFLFLPILVYRLLSVLKISKNKPSGSIKKPSIFNPLLFLIIQFENKLLKHLNFPFGVSTFCIVNKKKEASSN